MKEILRSGELWGRESTYGGSAKVKAYRGSLATEDDGFEFFAFAEPDLRAPVVVWTPRGDGFVREEDDVVKLDVLVTKVSQDVAW